MINTAIQLRAVAASLMLLLAAITATAQKTNENVDIMYYFGCHDGDYITLDGGITSYKVSSSLDSYYEHSIGGQAKIAYQHYFRKHLGLGIGLMFNRIEIDSMPISGYVQRIPGARDEKNRTYEHLTCFHNFSEEASINVFSIPAMIYYQNNIGISWKYYLAGGAMMSYYAKNSYKTRGSLETRAHYPEYNLEVGNITGHHIYSDSSFVGSYSFNPNIAIIGEAGLLYAINPRLDAYISINGHYRLSPLPEHSSNLLYQPDCMEPDAYQDIRYNGLLNSTEAPKVSPLALGASIGIRYRLNKEAKLDFQDYKHRSQIRDLDELSMTRVRRSDFNNHVQKTDQDSIQKELLRQEEERLKREQQLQDSLRRVQDSLANIAADPGDTANVVIVRDTINIRPTIYDDEIDRLITVINQNNCAFNKSNLENKRKIISHITRLSEILHERKDITLLIVGHTCDIGTEEQNKTVGLRRAESMRDLMIEHGADPEQLRCSTKWWTEPLVPNTSEKNRAQNRRVEIKRN